MQDQASLLGIPNSEMSKMLEQEADRFSQEKDLIQMGSGFRNWVQKPGFPWHY